MARTHKPYVLTDADRALIAEAHRHFRQDFRYAEAVMWAARERPRKPQPTAPPRKPQPTAPEPVDPAADMVAALKALEARLVHYVTLDPSGCWVWTGGLTGSGQPVLRLGPDNKVQQVRRWLYEQTVAAIPGKRRALSGDACHIRCVHPDHVLILADGMRSRTRKVAA